MRHLKYVSVAIALSASMTTAQAADFPPVVNDLAQGYDFADGHSPDMVGIALGMPRGDALAAIKTAYPDAMLGGGKDSMSVGDGKNHFTASYYRSDNATAMLPESDGDASMEVTYTTSLTGERVAGIFRVMHYGTNEPSMPEFVAAVTAKYGQPSLTLPTVNGRKGQTLLFVWKDGRLVPMSEDELGSQTGPGQCMNAVANSDYSYIIGTKDQYPGCTAVMVIELKPGPRDDLISEIDMRMTDYRRRFDNAVETNRYMDAELAKVVAAEGGGTTPAL